MPSESILEKLKCKLELLKEMTLWHVTKLSDFIEFDSSDKNAVGAMAIPLSYDFQDMIVWFRPEMLQEIKWGGDPRKSLNPQNLTPRKSFELWVEKIEGSSRDWSIDDQEIAKQLLFSFMRGIFKKAAELSSVNKELLKISRAKDEFIGMVSHELRTPLGVMIGWVDILKDEISQNTMALQALEIIDRNAKFQINLINDLLDVSRIISGKMRINIEHKANVSKF